MQSKAKTVDLYLKEVPPERKEALVKLRKLCVQELKGFDESMEYGGPAYSKNGAVVVGFMSQKNFIALYILIKDVLDKYRKDLKGISAGKGSIRYTHPDKIDFDLVKKILIETSVSHAKICPRE